ncbi:MAG: hypothetical protein QXT06_07350 [Candidatus Bathyarchaeia archaeon]
MENLKKNFIIVEYPDRSSVVYAVSGEAETVEEVTSEVFEQWNLKIRNKDGSYSWVRIDAPSRGDEIVIRTFGSGPICRVNRSNIKKDELTRIWVK